ncbi:hypothetical protein [Lacrimispora sp.]|uniref:hypothetical protein n=1 Tax=Lacrimispora sp. TaxID=2719234 RepID=UPI0028ADA71B|nr:hypothetical protein [Lacrimispora sp.]
MSRKTSKEYREDKARREKALQAEIAMAIKAPPHKTGSAKDPPYLFTCLCPDPNRRESKYAPMLRIHKSMLHEKNRRK